MPKIRLIFLVFICVAAGCGKKQPKLSGNEVSNVINQMTGLMVHDVTNPPLAARFFAYTCLAGYEVVAQNDPKMKSMFGRLKQYPKIEKPASLTGYDYRLGAIFAMLETAQKMQPSGKLLIAYEDKFADSCKRAGFDEAMVDSSRHYGQFISTKILKYAKSDRYNRISNFPRYKPSGLPGAWAPTPPAFMAPVEPYFNTVRPLTLDTVKQFKAAAPVPFSTDKNSVFFKFLKQNYEKSGDKLTKDEKDIANFWDCNPFAVQNDGHMLIGLKKISPGAHWMAIAGIACRESKADFSKAMQVHTTLAVGLLDAFICCWDEKFRSNRIRPETAIRQLLDANWVPLLQTPPFPEYLSGHSVASAASSVILTRYFGNNFGFTDSTEISYGVPPRKFSSFEQAANEAAISRFYGGIHFMDAITEGFKEGTLVGNHVLNTMSAK